MKFDNVALYKPEGGKTYCFKIPAWAKPNKRHCNTHQANKEEAAKVRDEYLTQMQSQGHGLVFNDAYLDKVIEAYFASKGYLAKRSFTAYTSTVLEFQDFVTSKMGRIPKIQEIDKPLCEAYLQGLLNRGLNPHTRNDRRNILTNLFRYAVDNNWLHKNPVSKIGKIEEVESDHPDPLSLNEVKSILDYLKVLNSSDNKYRCKCYYEIMAVVYYTGARISEVTHLFKTDVDFAMCRINIRSKIIPKEFSGEIGRDNKPIVKKYRTKTKRQWSTPIVPELEIIVRQWMKQVKDNPSPLLFPNLNSCPVDTDDVYNVVRKVMQKLGFSAERISRPLHRGRHTFASITRQKGVEEPLVQQALGHKSNIMTRHYTHLDPRHIRDEFRGLSYGQGEQGKV